MKFTNFYTNQICSPSLGSLLTGMHTGHGMIRENYELERFADSLEYGQMALQANMQTLGTELQKAGCVTAVMGKWGVGDPRSAGIPTLQGIDYFYGYLDQKQAHNYYPTHLWRNEVKENLPNPYFSSHPKSITIKEPDNPAAHAQYTGKDIRQILSTKKR